MKNQVLTILQMTPEAYDKLVLDMYFDWCAKKSHNQKSLQKVLTCGPLFNWWYKQLETFELHFIDDAKDYSSNITQEAAVDYYRHSTKDIFKLFSKPLMKKAHDA